jgi:hypothetical protein
MVDYYHVFTIDQRLPPFRVSSRLVACLPPAAWSTRRKAVLRERTAAESPK